MIKLWAHECLRVFQDRLISSEDRAKFDDLLKEVVKEKFKKEFDPMIVAKPLLFASFVHSSAYCNLVKLPNLL